MNELVPEWVKKAIEEFKTRFGSKYPPTVSRTVKGGAHEAYQHTGGGIYVPLSETNGGKPAEPNMGSVGPTKSGGTLLFKPGPLEIVQVLKTQVPEEIARLRCRLDEALVDLKTREFMCDGTIPCVPTPQFKTFEREMEQKIKNTFEGVLRRGEYPPSLERLARTEHGREIIRRAVNFDNALDRLDQLNGSHRRDPIVGNSATNQNELRRRGFSAGLSAIRELLGERIDANNGHDKMKWFSPRGLA